MDNPPNLALVGSLVYMVLLARAGAVSLKSTVQTSEDLPSLEVGTLTVMKPPPPIPEL